MSEISDELVQRMVALVRDLYAHHQQYDMHDREQDFCKRTADIIADLPDPDIPEAMRLICTEYGQTHYPDGRLLSGDGPARVDAIRSGKGREYWEVRVVAAAIKRGRELQKAEASHG